MMKQRWGLDRNVLRPTPCDPWGVNNTTGILEQKKTNSWTPVILCAFSLTPPAYDLRYIVINKVLFCSVLITLLTVRGAIRSTYVLMIIYNVIFQRKVRRTGEVSHTREVRRTESCGEMVCSGLLTIILEDKDGTFLGEQGAAISAADDKWNDATWGRGDNKIPRAMLTDRAGRRKSIDDVRKYTGRSICLIYFECDLLLN